MNGNYIEQMYIWSWCMKYCIDFWGTSSQLKEVLSSSISAFILDIFRSWKFSLIFEKVR